MGADLTIKRTTLPIKFKSDVNPEINQITTKFIIDRTEWNITFQSTTDSSTFKEYIISDAIEFDVVLNFL